jgi:transcriptional regulator with XRE-family HTH domain
LSKIERGESTPTLDTILNISIALKVSPHEFFEAPQKIDNNQKGEIIDKINIILLKLSFNDLTVLSRIFHLFPQNQSIK